MRDMGAVRKWRDVGLEKRKQFICITHTCNKRVSVNSSQRILVAFLECQPLALWTFENTIADQ